MMQKLDGTVIFPVSGFVGTVLLPTSSICLENMTAV